MRNQPPTQLAMTNKIANGAFADMTGWTEASVAGSVSNGVYTGTASAQYAALFTSSATINAHQYYAAALVKSTTNQIKLKLLSVGSGMAHSGSNTFEHLSVVDTANGAGNFPAVTEFRAAAWDAFSVKYFICIDLTATFGAGNEPTAAEMDAMLANYDAVNSWFNGTQNITINPAGKYYLADTGALKNNPAHMLNMGYTAASGPQSGSPPYVKFDGTDDYARRTLASAIASGSDISISVWVRATDVTATKQVFRLDNMTGKGFYFYNASSKIYVEVYDDTTSKTANISIAGNNNLWLNYVAAYSSATKTVSLWLNGTGVQTSAALTNQMVQVTDVIVSNTHGLASYYPGDYSDWAIFSKTLTASEVRDLYNRRATAYGRSKI